MPIAVLLVSSPGSSVCVLSDYAPLAMAAASVSVAVRATGSHSSGVVTVPWFWWSGLSAAGATVLGHINVVNPGSFAVSVSSVDVIRAVLTSST